MTLRNKVPYFRDTARQGENLTDGANVRQTLPDTSNIYSKDRLERSIPNPDGEVDGASTVALSLDWD